MVHPELVPASLPRKRVALEHDLSFLDDRVNALLGASSAVRDGRLAFVFVVVEGSPLSNGRDPGDELRLTRTEAVDADPVLSAEREQRV